MFSIDQVKEKAKGSIKTLVFPESYDDRMLQAAAEIAREGWAEVILLGNADVIEAKRKELGIDLRNVGGIDPRTLPELDTFADELVEIRKKKGLSRDEAKGLLTAADNLFFGALMVRRGDADGMVAGASNSTGNVLRAG
ncbi:MAG: phosphate acetyltransferase, partial [Deltaproteobacteria bacterium]|nr:phosphate acetyltransferase [Deltaproteobacteria bacterium]